MTTNETPGTPANPEAPMPAPAPAVAAAKRDRYLFALATVLIMITLMLVSSFSRAVKKAEDDEFWEFTALYSEIFKKIRERYVDEVDSKKLFEGALQGMFLNLDPHSQFMDSDHFTQLEKDTEGAFSGIGIHITVKDGVLTVISPMPGSPAAKAGVRPWDRIIEIDGKKTQGMNSLDAVKKLTGPSGTTVKISVYREGQTDYLNFTLVRKSIKIESVYSKMMEDNIGYIRLARFSDNSTRDMRKVMEEMKQNGVKAFVLDLRFNTGGLLKEAVGVSNLFLPRGKLVVSTKGRIRSQNSELRTETDPLTDLPVVVLINKGTASASEIVAGALKDHNRGVVVGIKNQRSFGKGSVQTIEELNHSYERDTSGNLLPAAIRLTTARYFMPLGETIDKVGVTPDIAVELPKGNESDVIRNGLLGEPKTEEDDENSSATKFDWSKYKGDDQSTATAASDAETSEPVEVNSEDDGESESAASRNDETSTGTQPRRVIPLDRVLFPNAELEGDAPKTTAKKKDKFVDYQLEVAKRLLIDNMKKGLDFYSAESGMPPGVDNKGKKQDVADSKPAEAPATTP